MDNKKFEQLLLSVQKPGRYSGGEINSVIKDKESVKCRFAFCFPDTYEIGMSNLGVRILYDCLNREEDIWCERVYDPWVDMQEKMRAHNLPLTALESGDPLSAFDFIGFTLQYEMSYTALLYMLDLAGIPFYAKDRGEDYPVIEAECRRFIFEADLVHDTTSNNPIHVQYDGGEFWIPEPYNDAMPF